MIDLSRAYIEGSFKMADIGYIRPENLPFFLYGHVTPITKIINGLIDAAIMIQEYEFVRRVQMIKDMPKNLKEDLSQFKNDIIKQ